MLVEMVAHGSFALQTLMSLLHNIESNISLFLDNISLPVIEIKKYTITRKTIYGVKEKVYW